MKKLLVVLLLLIAVVGLFWWQGQGRGGPYANEDARGEVWVAFGDSLTAGPGIEPDQRYPVLLEKHFGIPVLNYGVNGDTTLDGRRRLQAALAERPQLVILLLGGNDLLQKKPRKPTLENLNAMVREILQSGAALVLAGVDAPIGGTGFPGEVRDLAARYKVPVIPNILKGINRRPSLMLSDRIHPNAAGHERMAEKLIETIERAYPFAENF